MSSIDDPRFKTNSEKMNIKMNVLDSPLNLFSLSLRSSLEEIDSGSSSSFIFIFIFIFRSLITNPGPSTLAHSGLQSSFTIVILLLTVPPSGRQTRLANKMG